MYIGLRPAKTLHAIWFGISDIADFAQQCSLVLQFSYPGT